jgi:metal-responsive CopG/Arc/MetJ family transcriptional regulator
VSDIIVSVRIPTALVLELKKRIGKEHFKDTSELVRTIVRKKWLEYQGLTKPKTSYGDLSRDELITELQKLVERLRR